MYLKLCHLPMYVYTFLSSFLFVCSYSLYVWFLSFSLSHLDSSVNYCHSLIRKGLLSYTIKATSSICPNMRRVAYHILSLFKELLPASNFRETPQVSIRIHEIICHYYITQIQVMNWICLTVCKIEYATHVRQWPFYCLYQCHNHNTM